MQDSANPPTGVCLAGFPKPAFQKSLAGKYRQLPDIAWLADPYTGVVIAISVPGQIPELVWQVWGGTSVACPMFSGLWAIANEEAGTPLGQAAQYLYSLPPGAIRDVVPVASTTNVKASIVESTGTNNYTRESGVGRAKVRGTGEVYQCDLGLSLLRGYIAGDLVWHGLFGLA